MSHTSKFFYVVSFLLITSFHVSIATPAQDLDTLKQLVKVKDLVIYKDTQFHAAFPSIIKKPDGSFLLAFRRAPNRKIFSENGTNHVDPNSYLMQMESKDGINWPKTPKVLYAHAFGGSQDPCLLQLRNGEIICASYGWAFPRQEAFDKLKTPYFKAGDAVFLGGYTVRSNNGGVSWSEPSYPPPIEKEKFFSAMGTAIPAYNRGAMYEGKNGKLFWVVAAHDKVSPKKTSNYLMTSGDSGQKWEYTSVVAEDDSASFNEASIYETPKGDLVAFLRTANMGDQACIARSVDGGKSFQKWESMGFKGHPLQAMRLPDNRVLLVYGYRHKPMGIRARVLNAECTDFKTAPEMVLRNDGGGSDLGYPWAVMLNETEVLVTYYFNTDGENRFIGGTMLRLE